MIRISALALALAALVLVHPTAVLWNVKRQAPSDGRVLGLTLSAAMIALAASTREGVRNPSPVGVCIPSDPWGHPDLVQGAESSFLSLDVGAESSPSELVCMKSGHQPGLTTVVRFMSHWNPTADSLSPRKRFLFKDKSCSRMAYFAVNTKPGQLILPKIPGGLT